MFLTFDLDRVLIQNPFGLGVFPDICRRLRSSPHLPNLAKQKINEHPEDTVMRLIRNKSDQRSQDGDWVGAYDWDEIVNEVACELGSREQIDVEALVRHYCRPSYITAYNDARTLLHTVGTPQPPSPIDALTPQPPAPPHSPPLTTQPSSIWWISNGFARYQLPVMEALGLQQYFDGYFAPDTHGAAKPHAAIFQAAIDAAGEPATQGVHVGDHLTHDIAGARRAGMMAVWIERCLPPVFHNSDPWELAQSSLFHRYVERRARTAFQSSWYGVADDEAIPDAVITSLDQLPSVLNQISQAPSRKECCDATHP